MATGHRITLDLPARTLDLAGTLLLPVALGQAARAVPLLERIATKRQRVLGIVSQLLVLAIMFRAAAEVAGKIRAYGNDLGSLALVLTIGLCLGNHLIALGVGWWGAGRLGYDRPARMAVGFAGSQKTLPVSLMLWQLYYPGYPLAVMPLLIYHAGQLIVDTFIADRWGAWATSEASTSPPAPPPPSTATWV